MLVLLGLCLCPYSILTQPRTPTSPMLAFPHIPHPIIPPPLHSGPSLPHARQGVSVKVLTGPAPAPARLRLFFHPHRDPFGGVLLHTYDLRLAPRLRHDVHGALGQAVRTAVVFRAPRTARAVVRTSHPDELAVLGPDRIDMGT